MPRSALQSRLSADDLLKLKDIAFQRLNDLRAERQAQGLERKLEKYEKISASDFQHRLCPDLQNQSIFDRSNQSLQIVRSIARFLKARMAKDLFGSTPWFAARPEGPSSFVLASEIQKHADWKLREGDYKQTAKKALEVALDLGWVALKTTWRTDEDFSEAMQNILFDPQGQQPDDSAPSSSSGAPVVPPSGDYLSDEDDTQDAPMTDAQGTPMLHPETGAPITQSVFAKAPNIPAPGQNNRLKFKPHLVEQVKRIYFGLDVQPIYWKDVLWPIIAPKVDLQHCDVISHTREMTRDELAAQYDPEGDDPDVQTILARLMVGDTNPKAEANMAKAEYDEAPTVKNDPDNATFKVTELYMRRTLPGNKGPSRIVVVVVEAIQEIIWCEYLAAISPQAECPIHVVAVNKVPGRAYGRGLYELYEMPAEVADRLINSVIWRNAINSDPVKFWNPSLTKEGDSDPHLSIEPGKTYTAKNPQTKASDILSIVEIADLDSRTWTMLELFMQLIQTESGVTNANQGDMSDLPSNNTATGVNSLLESSSVLHFDVLEELRDGISPQLRYAIELIYFRQDQDETYEYLEGNAAAVMTLAQAMQLSKLPMHVEILLTRSKRQELRDAALSAIPHGWNFWQAVRSDPESALHMLPLYLQVFRALEIDNADAFFPKPADLQAAIDARQQAQAQGQSGQPGAPAAPLGGSEAGPVAQPSDPGGGTPETAASGTAGEAELPRNVIPAAA
jgi:hypothetical protein